MKNIYYNGVIHAEKDMDVSAMGVENGRIGVIGGREEAEKWAQGSEAVRHDLNGCFVVPGFQDSHLHLLEYGYGLSAAGLSSCTSSLASVLEGLSEYKEERDLKPGSWIVARGWNHDYFQDEKRFPTRRDLDRVSLSHPIIAYRACGHIACVNTAALEAAGITGQTPQPEGGCFDLDEMGEPTGVLREYGIDLVSRVIPPPDKGRIKSFIRQAMGRLNAYGITSAHSDDLSAFPGVDYETVLDAYRELEEEGLMTLKVYEQCLLPDMKTLKRFAESGYRTGSGSRYFAIGPLKIISDGSLGARTAYLSRPYADDEEHPDNCGIPIYSQQELDEMIGYGADHGMQVAVHAIGDRAMEMAVGALGKAMGSDRENPLRHGIVHCQITTKELLKEFKKWNLHGYIQSIFLDYDSHIVEKRVGKERASDTYQFKTLFKLGTGLSNGSDAPVECPDVLAGIQCAVTRTTLDGTKTFLPDQSLSVEEALETYTAMGARASFEEDEKGRLLPGMAADFTVLSRDIRRCGPDRIRNVRVMGTYVDGVCVFGRDLDFSSKGLYSLSQEQQTKGRG
ncbi:amidohydrolase [Lachnospiraceae bacterium 54-53]